MSDLFQAQVLRVEQPRRLPAAKSQYKVFDGHGTLLATASERAVPLRRQATRALFGNGADHRVVHVERPDGAPLLVLERRPSAGTWVSGPYGEPIGSLQVDRHLYRYRLLDAAERPVGRLEGNRLARKFQVFGQEAHVAQVDKKWTGVATEVLTTADRYAVEIFQPLPDPLRVLVVAAPIALDLMLYEGKDFG
jgi:hypothetical protein